MGKGRRSTSRCKMGSPRHEYASNSLTLPTVIFEASWHSSWENLLLTGLGLTSRATASHIALNGTYDECVEDNPAAFALAVFVTKVYQSYGDRKVLQILVMETELRGCKGCAWTMILSETRRASR